MTSLGGEDPVLKNRLCFLELVVFSNEVCVLEKFVFLLDRWDIL